MSIIIFFNIKFRRGRIEMVSIVYGSSTHYSDQSSASNLLLTYAKRGRLLCAAFLCRVHSNRGAGEGTKQTRPSASSGGFTFYGIRLHAITKQLRLCMPTPFCFLILLWGIKSSFFSAGTNCNFDDLTLLCIIRRSHTYVFFKKKK